MIAKKNQIYVGSLNNPDYYFENDQIFSCGVVQATALIGQELSIDTFSPVVADSEDNLLDIYHFRSSDGQEIQTGVGQVYCVDTSRSNDGSDLINLEYGTPVWYYHEDELVGKFYVSYVKREGRNKYQINCVSAIGLLEKKYHGGGLFLSTTFGAVLSHILASGLHGTGNPVIDYVIDDDVANLTVSGWLPYATKRNNLYQLIFANGVNIIKNHDGRPRFTFVYTAPTGREGKVKDGNIYNEGNVEYTKPYSKVVISEHTYTASTINWEIGEEVDWMADEDSITLFDNTDGQTVTNEEIWFDYAPVITYTLATDGSLTVVSATENSAVITGKGKLTGIPYVHTMRTVSRTNSGTSEDKEVRVEDCTMVNVLNSNNLLERLFAFYCPQGHIERIRNEVILTKERCGKMYSLKNPYLEQKSAFLASIDITASSVNKASCEWYAGYVPAGQAGLYKHVVILVPEWDEENEEWIYTGTWKVPDNVTQFKAILIGGGTGGGSGYPGQNGKDAYSYVNRDDTTDLSSIFYGAKGGKGGNGGVGGSPGRVKVFTVQNAVAGTQYSYTLGAGGDGGAATGFIPDTTSELRAALKNEHPDVTYTDAQINTMIAQEDTDWDGNPNAGSVGGSTNITDGTDTWSTDDNDGYVPTGGVYEPIGGNFYALGGNQGIKGGDGGARKIEHNGEFEWSTDGEDVVGDSGEVYHGGSTGVALISVNGLDEARLIAYGGNGAGAAVGIDSLTHEHINGDSSQTATWEIVEDT